MVYVKRLLILSFVCFLSGCASLRESFSDGDQYTEGYKQGVKENVNTWAQGFYGNDFPYFNWSGPEIQQVKVPAMLANGEFIPEHYEPVMVQPGEWRHDYGYPISSNSKGGENEQTNQGQYNIRYSTFDVSDISVVPKDFTGADKGCESPNNR